MGLRLLGLEQIPLMQLHRIDPKVPLEDQVGELAKLREEGKIRFIGLSEVTVDQLRAAADDRTDRHRAEPVQPGEPERRGTARLQRRQRHRLHPVVPAGHRGTGQAGQPAGRAGHGARRDASQLALAWLLRRSPVMLPIPGTASVAHLEDNVAAAGITLSEGEYAALEAAVK